MNSIEQQFLDDLEKKLWTAADKLRSALDAAVYKHVVLGLIFLKYVSDAFEERQNELKSQFSDPSHDYYMDPADYGEDYESILAAELEVRDYYTEKNVFWVPLEARWQTLRDCAQLPPKAALPWNKPGKEDPEEMRTVGWLVDNAMEAIERENEKKLKNILNKEFARTQIDSHKLADLIAHFSDTQFHAKEYNSQPLNLKSKDILGHVYEYFLGQFALAEGKKGGQYYTPKSIVTLIVEMLQPFKGRVYDPAMGSGGFFVQSEEFIEQHTKQHANAKERTKQISVYGQESNPTTWRLAAMNMAIRGIDFNFGGGPADTLLNDQHSDLRADYVMANPPFNMKEWWSAKLENDWRWLPGCTPPQGNANFAWLQHMLAHLAPTGSMALLLANGSMSSNTNNEGEIRKQLVERDFVECMVALPGQLFTNTQIPACIWFLTKDKANGFNLDKKKRDRRGQFLFIDARQLGYMKDRVLRDFTVDDIQKVADTFHAWQQGENYENVPGFCYSASLDDIRKHEHVLTPGRYVGAEEQEADGEIFADKMARLTAQLAEQFAESAKLEGEIKKNLAGLGFPFPQSLGAE